MIMAKQDSKRYGGLEEQQPMSTISGGAPTALVVVTSCLFPKQITISNKWHEGATFVRPIKHKEPALAANPLHDRRNWKVFSDGSGRELIRDA